MLRVELYFGPNVDAGPAVSDRECTQFVAREMTPRFGGMMIVNAQRAWREVREKNPSW